MPPSPSSAIPRRPRRGRSSSMWWGPGSPTAGRTAPSKPSSRSTTSTTPCYARSRRSSTTPTSRTRSTPVRSPMGWTRSCGACSSNFQTTRRSQATPTSSTTASTHTCGGRRSSLDPPKIEVRRLTYEVGGTEILAGVDALVPDGEITAVVGPSGAGKSTLLRAINRLIEPSSGEVYLDGVPTSGLDPLQLRRRVGMVFQIPVLFGGSVEEAVLYGARLSGKDADPGRLLEMVGLDASLAGRDPQALSVGQQQRVSVARALALEPEALLLDEPTSALDEAARRRIEELVRDLNDRLGLTMVFVSHDLAQVGHVADQVVVLADGRNVGAWTKDAFYSGAGERARQFIAGRL